MALASRLGMPILYSKVKLLGHPVHPMLIAFPISAFVASVVGFAVYIADYSVTWFRVGYWTAVVGVVTALVAAVPGFIDWAFGIPKGTDAKRTGLMHMALNLGVVAIFSAIVLLYRDYLDAPPVRAMGPLVLALVGNVMLLVSGYLGGELVQRHHVGIDLSQDQRDLESRR